MKPLFIWCAIVNLALSANCQYINNIYSMADDSQVKLGYQVPDIELKPIVNYPQEAVNISNFKGKLLILDFWATWCAPCVAAFPKLDSLQKRFEGKLQILPVTKERRDLVDDFLDRMSEIKKIKWYSVTEDFFLNQIFKHSYIPHYVWIDDQGRYVTSTEGQEVNEKNIENAIDGKYSQLKTKKDVKISIVTPAGKPFFTSGILLQADSNIQSKLLPDSQIVMRTLISKYVEGAMGHMQLGTDNLISARNQNIYHLYNLAFWKNSVQLLNRSNLLTRVEITDEKLYEKILTLKMDGSRLVKSGLQTIEWLRENGYCYELVVPNALAEKKYDVMLDDLNRFFGPLLNIEGHRERRMTKYLALTRVTDKDLLVSKGGPTEISVSNFHLTLKNQNIDELITSLYKPLQTQPPLFDETGYKGNIDIDIKCSLTNLVDLNAQLKRYGLAIIVKEKVMDIGIIKLKR